MYDKLTLGTIISEDQLKILNRNIYNGTLVGVPTGNTSSDGSPEYELQATGKSTGTTLVNGKPQGTVFGADMVIAQERAEIAGKWNLGLNPDNATIAITTTGYVKILADETVLEFHSGTASDGAVVFTSKQRIRYRAGTPIYGKFTTSFPELSDSNGDYTMGIGLGEGFGASDNGLGIYQRRVSDVLEYGVVIVREGVTTYYPYNGTLPTDPHVLNIYRIEWGYLGIAPFNVYWRDTANEKWVRFHRQVFNTEITSVTRPDLPVGAFVQNQGNTTDIKITNGSYEAGTINGGKGFDVGARQQVYERAFTGTSGTNNLIFAFRNPSPTVTMYDGIDGTLIPSTRAFVNAVASQLLEVGLNVLDNNKIVDVDVVIVPSADLTDGTFTPVNLGYSVLQVSEDVTPVLTNANFVELFSLGKDTVLNKMIETLDLLIPSQTALFVYTTTSVNFDFQAFIKYQDLF